MTALTAGPTHQLNKFLNAFQGGTRPNRFKLTCSWNNGQDASTNSLLFETHCVASSLPGVAIGQIQIPFRGRMYAFPGDRVYADWDVTIIDDIAPFNSWEKFHNWHNYMNRHNENITEANNRNHRKSYAEVAIEMLDHNDSGDVAIRQINLVNAYPVTIGPVELDMTKKDALAQFAVKFSYTHFSQISGDSTSITNL